MEAGPWRVAVFLIGGVHPVASLPAAASSCCNAGIQQADRQQPASPASESYRGILGRYYSASVCQLAPALCQLPHCLPACPMRIRHGPAVETRHHICGRRRSQIVVRDALPQWRIGQPNRERHIPGIGGYPSAASCESGSRPVPGWQTQKLPITLGAGVAKSMKPWKVALSMDRPPDGQTQRQAGILLPAA